MQTVWGDRVQLALAALPKADNGVPRLLVTGGPTCEDIDAVRFITNRSSGRTGIAIAEAAHARGWPTLLILGPTAQAVPATVACVRVRSAADMFEAVTAAFGWCQALVMSAAVADYTPTQQHRGKLRKSEGELALQLKRTTDILAHIGRCESRRGKYILGFSLGAEMDEEMGRQKLQAKNLDAILVNATSSFAGPDTTARLLHRDGRTEDLGTLCKSGLANHLLDAVGAGLGD